MEENLESRRLYLASCILHQNRHLRVEDLNLTAPCYRGNQLCFFANLEEDGRGSPRVYTLDYAEFEWEKKCALELGVNYGQELIKIMKLNFDNLHLSLSNLDVELETFKRECLMTLIASVTCFAFMVIVLLAFACYIGCKHRSVAKHDAKKQKSQPSSMNGTVDPTTNDQRRHLDFHPPGNLTHPMTHSAPSTMLHRIRPEEHIYDQPFPRGSRLQDSSSSQFEGEKRGIDTETWKQMLAMNAKIIQLEMKLENKPAPSTTAAAVVHQ